MKKYNTFLNEVKETKSEINEASIQDAEKRLKEYTKTIQKVVNGISKGATQKTVSREMGPGYSDDFYSIISNLEDALMGIEDILHEIDIETSPR